MNPRARDTVTSTRATNSTTNTTTNLTTTGVRLANSTRKRRQQPQQQQVHRGRAEDASKSHPEIKPPPVKARRRTSKAVTESTERTSSKSRLGDFLSTLASRIRGPKHSSVMDDREKSKNWQVVDATLQPSMKPDEDEVAEDHEAAGSKRRKLEPNECSIVHHQSVGVALKNVGFRSVERHRDGEATTTEGGDPSVEATKDVLEEQPSVEVAEGAAVHSESNTREECNESGGLENVGENGASISGEKGELSEEPSKSNASVERSVSNLTVNLEYRGVAELNRNSGRKAEVSASSGRERDRVESEVGNCSSRYSLRSMMKSARRDDDATRLRKTIHWLEEGGRRLRQELTEARSQIYEERKAAKLARRELEAAVKEARNAEAAKYASVVVELKARLAQSPSPSVNDCPSSSSKTDILKDENHRREVAALKKRLAEAESTIQKLKTNSLDRSRVRKKTKEDESVKAGNAELRKLAIEVQNLRTANKKLEEKLHVAEESARARAAELRAQHETHEAESAGIQRALRSDTIKLIDEIQSKNREIEKLERLLSEHTQINEKLRAKEDETMRKLRENQRNQQLRLATRIEEKIRHEKHVVEFCKGDSVEVDDEMAAPDLGQLRELAMEQQRVIEVLRQAVKEKDRKLEQLTNKRRKEEFYKQWLELEPVAEVDDEDEQQLEDGGDSVLSSAPSSLSPQPSGHNGQFVASGPTREAYESLLMEVGELQAKLSEERHELALARDQVLELEKALLQETRGNQTYKRAFSEKLRVAEEREVALAAELSELREQNEVLEFRVLELEESPNLSNTPDPADSGIVSPEPIHLYKEQAASKHRDRAIATVIPYSSTYNSQPVLATDAQKGPLSLQESGIFDDENEENADETEERASSGDASSTSGTSSTGEARPCKPPGQATPSEAPAGELLQEVQRLQELRARIQERAAKVPPAPAATPPSERRAKAEGCEGCRAAHERIRELEERLSRREAERELSKQREEELLDENYRLAENTYWLQSELERALAGREAKGASDAEAPAQGTAPRDRPCPDCVELWQSCDAKLRSLASTESRLRQQVASLEQREAAFFETLRQADATWAKLEADYESRQREVSERLAAQLELNRALFEHLTELNKAEYLSSQELDVATAKPAADAAADATADAAADAAAKPCERCNCASLASRSSSLVESDSAASRLSTISRTSISMQSIAVGCDQVDTDKCCGMPVEPPTEVATEAKEEEKEERTGALKIKASEGEQPELHQPESHVYIDESSGEKKQIIYFRWR
ncbi:janus kinase and microtubule-interacting protein 2-like [Phymastichus coffea]|uniref:janus kinase and microtubule-interacting protein 2-like n=1 Tax=Phymastichus coffea TaxID=108790 RepID=UPI00273C2EC5|nr:janus kinase and microtubule-interacting protein 2-like [Phymastichus coffea]